MTPLLVVALCAIGAWLSWKGVLKPYVDTGLDQFDRYPELQTRFDEDAQ